jgi:hypothetical protein
MLLGDEVTAAADLASSGRISMQVISRRYNRSVEPERLGSRFSESGVRRGDFSSSSRRLLGQTGIALRDINFNNFDFLRATSW